MDREAAMGSPDTHTRAPVTIAVPIWPSGWEAALLGWALGLGLGIGGVSAFGAISLLNKLLTAIGLA